MRRQIILDDLHRMWADLLWESTLQSTPIATHRWRWMTGIKVGDYVMETTTRYRETTRRFGWLLEDRVDVKLHDDGSNETYKERVWVVETADGPVTWTNAHFVRLPIDQHRRDLFTGHQVSRCEMMRYSECERVPWYVPSDGRTTRIDMMGYR